MATHTSERGSAYAALTRRRARSHSGFTLVEISIVIVMVGILAAISVIAFIRYRRSTRMAEATNLISMIKSEQEGYKNERGVYASVSTSVDSYYPATNPGAFATMWGGPCTSCGSPTAWELLPVKPDAPVMYGYATIAGVGADIGSSSSSSSGGSSSSSSGGGGNLLPGTPLGSADDDSTPISIGNNCNAIGTTQPFYVIKAKGDTDGDSVACTVLSLSCSNTLILTNEGE